MQIRVITLRFNATLDGFDDTSLVEFVRGKEVLAVREYFFERNQAPYLAVVVTYTPPPVAQPKPQSATIRADRPDETWRSLLSREDEPVFEALRSWRAERAKAEGVPPYVIFTNRHLAEIAHARPATRGELSDIEGIGKAKCERFAEGVFAVLGIARTDDGSANDPAETPAEKEAPDGG